MKKYSIEIKRVTNIFPLCIVYNSINYHARNDKNAIKKAKRIVRRLNIFYTGSFQLLNVYKGDDLIYDNPCE